VGEIDSYSITVDLAIFMSLQQAHRRANGGMPPPWAMVAIAILGFNEIMALLRYLSLPAVCAVVS
jgi:hypothetical protein